MAPLSWFYQWKNQSKENLKLIPTVASNLLTNLSSPGLLREWSKSSAAGLPSTLAISSSKKPGTIELWHNFICPDDKEGFIIGICGFNVSAPSHQAKLDDASIILMSPRFLEGFDLDESYIPARKLLLHMSQRITNYRDNKYEGEGTLFNDGHDEMGSWLP